MCTALVGSHGSLDEFDSGSTWKMRNASCLRPGKSRLVIKTVLGWLVVLVKACVPVNKDHQSPRQMTPGCVRRRNFYLSYDEPTTPERGLGVPGHNTERTPLKGVLVEVVMSQEDHQTEFVIPTTVVGDTIDATRKDNRRGQFRPSTRVVYHTPDDVITYILDFFGWSVKRRKEHHNLRRSTTSSVSPAGRPDTGDPGLRNVRDHVSPEGIPEVM